MLYKSVLFAFVAALCWLMYSTIMRARNIRASASVGVQAYNQTVLSHQNQAQWLWVTTLLFILLIESKRWLYGNVAWDWLFYVHLPVAVVFFAALTANVFRFNGIKADIHPLLGYACAILFVPTAVLGVIMIWRMKLN